MRPFVRFVSALLALAVAAAGGLLALETAWHWLWPDEPPLLVPWPQWRTTLGAVSWNDDVVLVTAGITAGAGLVLVVLALLARPKTIRFADPAPSVSVSTTPRSLARAVGQHVRGQDNVDAATVTVTARSVKVSASSRFATEDELRERVRAAVGEQLDDLPLTKRPKLSVSARSERSIS